MRNYQDTARERAKHNEDIFLGMKLAFISVQNCNLYIEIWTKRHLLNCLLLYTWLKVIIQFPTPSARHKCDNQTKIRWCNDNNQFSWLSIQTFTEIHNWGFLWSLYDFLSSYRKILGWYFHSSMVTSFQILITTIQLQIALTPAVL